MSKRYLAIHSEVNGNERTGFHRDWHWDGIVFDRRELAVAHGFTFGRSDDFNIGVVDSKTGRLASIDWMETVVDDGATVLTEVDAALDLPRRIR